LQRGKITCSSLNLDGTHTRKGQFPHAKNGTPVFAPHIRLTISENRFASARVHYAPQCCSDGDAVDGAFPDSQPSPRDRRANGVVFNPDDYPYYEVYLRSFQEQRQALSLDLRPIRVHSDHEIEAAITTFAAEPGGGLITPPSTFNTVHRHTTIEQSIKHRLPAVVHFREAVVEGGLMCYAPDQADIFRRSASYVDRILKGAHPGDLPVQSPIKFEFVINLKTAKTLGLTVSPNLLAIADEVIQ
jgi:hypothetical protein